MALTYIVERAHPNYAGRLPLAVQARLIRGAQGISGANLDYLISTLRHLAELGIRERELERLLAVIGPHAARVPGDGARRQHEQPSAMLRAARAQARAGRGSMRPEQRRRFLYRLRMG